MRVSPRLSGVSKFFRPRVTFPSVEFEFRLSSPRVLAALWPVVIKPRLPISQNPLSPEANISPRYIVIHIIFFIGRHIPIAFIY